LAGKCCLVLDDEFIIALDIEEILQAAGATTVVSVSNTADALAALRTQTFHAAVLDVRLNDDIHSSMAIAGQLAAQGAAIVFLTGVRGEDEHTRNFPFAPVVEKPYQTLTLLEALRKALAAR
jgi:CheY-like chemotaxis protein